MGINRGFAKFTGLAIVVALTIGAFASASASAATWTVEGSKLSEGTANGLPTSTKLKAGTTATLKSTLLGQEFVLTASSLSISSGTIFQEGSKAKGSGVLELSGLSIDKPAGCSVESPIKTKALTSELVDVAGNENRFQKIFPEEGEVLATIKVSGCALAGSYNLKGVIYALDSPWGILLALMLWAINTHINHTAAGSGVTLGASPAELSAEFETGLSSGKKFGGDT
jgi:hypothetical protein